MEVSSTTKQVTVERVVVATLEAAALRVDLEQPVNGLGLEAGRLGHTFRGAAGRSAQQKVGALRREDAQNGIDDGSFPNTGTTGDDQHLGHQGEPDRGDLAFGKGKTDTPLDPRQGLVRIDPGPRQLAICQPQQPLGDGALRPVQAGQKHTRCFANSIGDHCALLQFEIERSANELLRNLEQLFGKRYQLFGRQAAMSLIHGLGQRIGNPRADPHQGGLLDAELHGDRVGRLESNAADVARQAIWVFGHDLDGVRAVGLVDAHCPRRADAVAVQEHHDFPHRFLLGPGSGDAAGSYRADAIDLAQSVRRRLNNVEHLLAEGAQELLGVGRADAPDHPG